MAIEDAITRLARAVESQGDTAAVREIIRQRDAALSDLANERRYHTWTQNSLQSARANWSSLKRSNAALRGAITRMKKRQKAEAR